MNQVDNKGVQGDSPTPPVPGSGTVENPTGAGNDKETNIAALRKQIEEKEEEIERLKKATSGSDQSLDLGNLPPPPEKDVTAVATRQVFQRDMKEATLQWTRSNKVSPEQWEAIRKSISFNGEETLTEIKDKIQNAYDALPDVRQAREQRLKEEGKQEAMKQHFDDEVSLPGGGNQGGQGSGGSGNSPRMPSEVKKWGRGLGLTDKELAEVDPDADASGFTILDPAYKDK